MSAAYDRRNARARAKGYRNYYDYRIHGSGTIPPSVEVTPEMRDVNRGHRSLQDFATALGSGRVHSLTPIGGSRDEAGRYTSIRFTVTFNNGRTRTYRLSGRQLSRNNLQRILELIERQNIDYLPDPSLDIFGRGLRAADAPDFPDTEDKEAA